MFCCGTVPAPACMFCCDAMPAPLRFIWFTICCPMAIPICRPTISDAMPAPWPPFPMLSAAAIWVYLPISPIMDCLLLHPLDLLRIGKALDREIRDADSQPAHIRIQIGLDPLRYLPGIGLQIEHVTAFPADPAHQQLIQTGNDTLLHILHGITLPDTGQLLYHNIMLHHPAVERAEGTDRHTARQTRRLQVNGILRPPFHQQFLRIDKKHLRPERCVESKPETLQRGQKRQNIRLDIIVAILLKNPLHSAVVQKNRILSRPYDQPGTLLDLLPRPSAENNTLVALVPLHQTGKLVFQKSHLMLPPFSFYRLFPVLSFRFLIPCLRFMLAAFRLFCVPFPLDAQLNQYSTDSDSPTSFLPNFFTLPRSRSPR